MIAEVKHDSQLPFDVYSIAFIRRKTPDLLQDGVRSEIKLVLKGKWKSLSHFCVLQDKHKREGRARRETNENGSVDGRRCSVEVSICHRSGSGVTSHNAVLQLSGGCSRSRPRRVSAFDFLIIMSNESIKKTSQLPRQVEHFTGNADDHDDRPRGARRQWRRQQEIVHTSTTLSFSAFTSIFSFSTSILCCKLFDSNSKIALKTKF